mmetsp:Transcript_26875/g.67822  ORF Transcript_26875/g.67822 Transcript_26875/m.67822 type:complete len:360 (-) Transcript_26875:129-1208(-)
MHRVPHHRHVALGPALEHRGGAVEQVPLVNLVVGGGVEHLEHLLAPPPLGTVVEELVQVVLVARPRLGPLGESQKGVPLRPPLADVGRDKVLAGPNVDLVAHVKVVVSLLDRVPREARVPAVRRATVGTARVLVPHLGADGAPDAVRPHKDVARHDLSILERHLDALTAGKLLVLDNFGVPLHHVVAANLVEEELLEVGAVDDARVGQGEVVGHVADGVELGVPLGADAVLDAIGARPGEGELLHDPVKEVLVDALDRRERVGGELDRAAEAGELVGLLEDLDLDALLLQRLGQKHPPHPPPGDNHLEGRVGRDGTCGLHHGADGRPAGAEGEGVCLPEGGTHRGGKEPRSGGGGREAG